MFILRTSKHLVQQRIGKEPSPLAGLARPSVATILSPHVFPYILRREVTLTRTSTHPLEKDSPLGMQHFPLCTAVFTPRSHSQHLIPHASTPWADLWSENSRNVIQCLSLIHRDPIRDSPQVSLHLDPVPIPAFRHLPIYQQVPELNEALPPPQELRLLSRLRRTRQQALKPTTPGLPPTSLSLGSIKLCTFLHLSEHRAWYAC